VPRVESYVRTPDPDPTTPHVTGPTRRPEAAPLTPVPMVNGAGSAYLAGLGLFCLGFLGVFAFLSMPNASNRTRSPRPRCRGEPE
jgi:hypothetical protein